MSSTCSTCAPTERKRISRRAVIKGAGAVGTVAVATPGFGTFTFASNNATRVGDVVVNIFLRGGMDGLSVVVPRHEGAGADFLAAAAPDTGCRSRIGDPPERRLRPPPDDERR